MIHKGDLQALQCFPEIASDLGPLDAWEVLVVQLNVKVRGGRQDQNDLLD